MKKVVGYLLVVAGIALIASSRVSLLFTNLSFLPKVILNSATYIGVALFVLGAIFFAVNKNNSVSVPKEVPIYQGKQIVGYRRQ